MENDKKIIVSTMVGIAVLLVLVVGASFAYFSVNATNSATNSTVKGTTESVGNVTLSGGSNLMLNITAENMAQPANNVTYYATTTGTPSTTAQNVTVATATVSGNGTMDCDYTLTIEKSATNDLYTAFKNATATGKGANQVVLKVNNGETTNGTQTYDFNSNLTFPITYNGTLTGLTSAAVRNITASFSMVNLKDYDQSYLAGKDITFTFKFTNFSCSLQS